MNKQEMSELSSVVVNDCFNGIHALDINAITENELIEGITNSVINAINSISGYDINCPSSFKGAFTDECEKIRAELKANIDELFSKFNNKEIRSIEVINIILSTALKNN